jgi:hypothetical protein
MCRTGSLWPPMWLVPKARVHRRHVAAQQRKRRGPDGFRPTNSFSFIRATVPCLLHCALIPRPLQLPALLVPRSHCTAARRRSSPSPVNHCGICAVLFYFHHRLDRHSLPRGALSLKVQRLRTPPVTPSSASSWFCASEVPRRPFKVSRARTRSLPISLFFTGAVEVFTSFFFSFFSVA